MRIKSGILLSTLAILASAFPSAAQHAGKMYRSGYIHFRSGPRPVDKAFVQVWREPGWMEARIIAIRYR